MTCWAQGDPGYCGPNPRVSAWGAGSNVINFSYGLTDLNQLINVNNAITSANGNTTGINVTGFKFSFQAKNGNGWDNAQQDQLNAYVKLYDTTNTNVLENYNYDLNRKYNWTTFSYNETFSNPRAVNTVGNAQVGFIGRDTNNWVGPYGPEIINVSFALKYRVDPCSLNPAYSSTCTGFGNIVNSTNLLDSTRGGTSLTQAFAINTALSTAGVGAMVHGFNYGFNYRVGDSWSGCTATNQDGSCSWYMDIPSRVSATVSLTNSSNQSIFSRNYNLTGDGISGSISDKYLLTSSMNQSLLGTGRISGSTSGTGSRIEGMWATLIYTADPCVANPLYSPDCKGYALALAKQYAPAPGQNSPATYSDGTQTVELTTGMLLDPAQPTQSAGTAGNTSPPPPGSEPPPGSPPPPQGSTQTASNNPASTPANQPSPQGGSSQPRAGEVKTASEGGSKSGPGLISVMSMISSNQARIGNEAKSVVQAAESAAAQSAQSAQQQAETVAGSLTAQSISGSMSNGNESSGTASKTTTQTQTSMVALSAGASATMASIEAVRPPTQATSTDTTQTMGTGLVLVNSSAQYSLPASQTSYMVSAVESPVVNFGFQLPSGRTSSMYEIEAPQNEGIKIGTRSTLNDVLEQRTLLQTTSQSQQTETVKRDIQLNDLAVGVDIASIARQPAGYQAYSVMMPDVAFYASRDIYRNQVNVDNTRLFRSLGSDRLHQEMINQQYKLGD